MAHRNLATQSARLLAAGVLTALVISTTLCQLVWSGSEATSPQVVAVSNTR